MTHDLLKRLSDPELIAIAGPGDAWPRPLFGATLIPDAWMGLIEQKDGRRRFVPAGEDPRPRGDDILLLVRNRAITTALDAPDTLAACGTPVRAAAELLLRWSTRDDDLAALRRTLVSLGELSLADLSAALADRGGARVALQQFIRSRPADALCTADLRGELFDALRGPLSRFLFDCGAQLDRVVRLDFVSPQFAAREAIAREARQQAERIAAREMVESAALAATQRRLSDLSGILEKLNAAAAGDPAMQWHDLLPSLTPAERGRLLENLWRITPDRVRSEAIVVVAGHECIWLDPLHPESIVRRLALPADLGGLRSVRFAADRRLLLIGAASGVWMLDAQDSAAPTAFAVADAGAPSTGFNAAAIAGQRLFATHSQLGCWSWALADAADAAALLRPAAGAPSAVRAATTARAGGEEVVLFAADDVVHVHAADGAPRASFPPARATIHDLAALDDRVYAATSAGTVLVAALDGAAGWSEAYRAAGAIESVHVRRWNDLVELVVPAGPLGVTGVYGREGVVTPLLRAGVSIRRAWACDDLVLALSDRRDRLIVMNANRPERSGLDVPLARLVGSSIQDVCIVTRAEQSAERPQPPDAERPDPPSPPDAA